MVSDIDTVIRSTGQRAIDRAPWLEPTLRAARTAYVKTQLETVAWRHRRRYSAPIDPYQLLWVDPDDIEYVAAKFEGSKFQRLGRVVGGDWDEPDILFTETDIYQGFEAHFDYGVPWDETRFFERVAAEIETGRRPWGCDSRDALTERCRGLDVLYDRIDREGYLSQPELLAAAGDATAEVGVGRHSTLARLLKDELSVDIGRDGRLLFADGRNRLSIAKLLGIERVPVLVLVRHTQWQGVRDRVAEHLEEVGGWPPAVERHPDLRRLETHTNGKPPEQRPRSIKPWL